MFFNILFLPLQHTYSFFSFREPSYKTNTAAADALAYLLRVAESSSITHPLLCAWHANAATAKLLLLSAASTLLHPPAS